MMQTRSVLSKVLILLWVVCMVCLPASPSKAGGLFGKCGWVHYERCIVDGRFRLECHKMCCAAHPHYCAAYSDNIPGIGKFIPSSFQLGLKQVKVKDIKRYQINSGAVSKMIFDYLDTLLDADGNLGLGLGILGLAAEGTPQGALVAQGARTAASLLRNGEDGDGGDGSGIGEDPDLTLLLALQKIGIANKLTSIRDWEELKYSMLLQYQLWSKGWGRPAGQKSIGQAYSYLQGMDDESMSYNQTFCIIPVQQVLDTKMVECGKDETEFACKLRAYVVAVSVITEQSELRRQKFGNAGLWKEQSSTGERLQREFCRERVFYEHQVKRSALALSALVSITSYLKKMEAYIQRTAVATYKPCDDQDKPLARMKKYSDFMQSVTEAFSKYSSIIATINTYLKLIPGGNSDQTTIPSCMREDLAIMQEMKKDQVEISHMMNALEQMDSLSDHLGAIAVDHEYGTGQ